MDVILKNEILNETFPKLWVIEAGYYGKMNTHFSLEKLLPKNRERAPPRSLTDQSASFDL